MTTGEFITKVQKFGYDVQDRSSATTAQDSKMRERILRSAQAGCEWIRHMFPWTWRRDELTAMVTSSAGYTATLPPAVFEAFGPFCTVYRDSDGREVYPKPLDVLERMRNEHPSTSPPEFYAQLNREYLRIYPAGTGNPTLNIAGFFRICPTLEDEDVGGDGDTLDDAVPAQYQETLLFDYVCIELKLTGGDDNYLPMRLELEKRVRQAWADENLGSGVRRVPRYGRGTRSRV